MSGPKDPDETPTVQDASRSDAPERRVEIPDHELLYRVGKGSYGEVWLARHTLGAYRAVKIVYRDTFDDAYPFEQELTGIRKFEPISRSHEGFVDILHVGLNEAGGYFYYVMEIGDDAKTGRTFDPNNYVPKTLAKEVTVRGRLPFDECLQLGLSLSGALSHLHEYGLVHRDIKPANVIFVDGKPKLADIGLVTEIAVAHTYVGTVGFIPPEGPGSPQADIYGLGKVLYEASTGHDRKEFPALPADLGELGEPEKLLELNEVVVKACHHKIKERYQTAREMRADLEVLQDGQSVQRLRVLERRWSHLKKYGSIGFLAVLVAGVAIYQVDHQRKLAGEVRQRQAGAQVAYGTRAMAEGDLSGALPFFLEALRLDHSDSDHEQTHRVRLGTALARCPTLLQMWFVGAEICDVRFGPDGSQVLVGLRNLDTRVFNVETGNPLEHTFVPDGRATNGLIGASFSPDGRFILTASMKGEATVWRANTGEPVLRLRGPAGISGAEFSPSGKFIVTADWDKKARIWDAKSGELLTVLTGHDSFVLHAEFSRDEQYLATASDDKTAIVWNIRTGAPTGPPMPHNGHGVNWACFSPDGTRLLTAGRDGKARIWPLTAGRAVPIIMDHSDAVQTACFSPDGRYVLTACLDNTARLWDAYSGVPAHLNPVLRHSSRVLAACFSPDGHRVVTGCLDGSVRVWDLAGSILLPTPVPGTLSPDANYWARATNNVIEIGAVTETPGFPWRLECPGPIQSIRFNQNGALLMAGYLSRSTNGENVPMLGIWASASGQAQATPMVFRDPVSSAVLSDDGRQLAVLSDRRIRLTTLPAGDNVPQDLNHPLTITQMTFNHAGDQLAAVGSNEVFLWRLQRAGASLTNHFSLEAAVSDISFNVTGSALLTATSDPELNERCAQIFDTATGHEIVPRLLHKDGVLHAAFSRDARLVVTASEDFSAIIWDAGDGRKLAPQLRHQNQVNDAEFSPNGRWIVTAAADRTARLWDATGGEPLGPPLEHSAIVRRAAFTSDGMHVGLVDSATNAWLWDLSKHYRPDDEVTRLTDLLIGVSETLTPVSLADRAKQLEASWNALRSAHPEDFRVEVDQVIAWHNREARLARANNDLDAVEFHDRWLRIHEQSKRSAQ